MHYTVLRSATGTFWPKQRSLDIFHLVKGFMKDSFMSSSCHPVWRSLSFKNGISTLNVSYIFFAFSHILAHPELELLVCAPVSATCVKDVRSFRC
jgi:energy-converting hydrogenase Eha subunit E